MLVFPIAYIIVSFFSEACARANVFARLTNFVFRIVRFLLIRIARVIVVRGATLRCFCHVAQA